jgi:hypothetical protein
MEFEFDERKSASNKVKHGIDFIEAQELWVDTDRVEIAARDVDEPRFLVIGQINGKHWLLSSHIERSGCELYQYDEQEMKR